MSKETEKADEIDRGIHKEIREKRTGVRKFMADLLNMHDGMMSYEEIDEMMLENTVIHGPNMWILCLAALIASIGLNMNSTAVIIGAMLISPLMGPIMGIGLSIGINDFQLLKKSLRNFLWMFVVSIITSTVYFLISPYSSAQSELLARTSPTTYDVLFGGVAGMLAQTRRDRTGTVISGVAIATALMPPLCTAGFGIASGEIMYVLGAFYLFIINTVFIALASYLMVIFLKYEKKTALDQAASKRMRRYVILFSVIILVPSMILTVNILRKTQFEANVDRYVTNVFQFNKTMLVDYDVRYRYEGRQSAVEVRLVGEPLSHNVIENASAQMAYYGLENTELIVRQADENERIDFSKIQHSYAEIIDEKNRTIARLEERLASVQPADTVAAGDISREMAHVADHVGRVSMSKHIFYDVQGVPTDTALVVTVRPDSLSQGAVEYDRIEGWLRTRLKTDNVIVYIEEGEE